MVRAQLRPLLDSYKNNPPQCWWEGSGLKDEMMMDWWSTKAMRNAQRVVLEIPTAPGYLWWKPEHRHHDSYRYKQSHRVIKLERYHRRARYFITLTADPKRYFNDIEACKGLLNSWNKIYKRLKRLNKDVQFFRFVEPTKTGIPHFHIVLWNVFIPLLKSWAAEMYKISSGYVKAQRARKGNAGAVSYCMKYVNKTGKDRDFYLAALTRWRAQTLSVCGKELSEFVGPLRNPRPADVSDDEWEKMKEEKKSENTKKYKLWKFIKSYNHACRSLWLELAEEMYAEEVENVPDPPQWGDLICQ